MQDRQHGSEHAPDLKPVLVDGHVHIYPAFPLARFFGAASDNFSRAARLLGLPEPVQGCLLLTETCRDAAFDRLADGTDRADGWQVRAGDAGTLTMQGPDGAELIVVAGRQIVTGEGIEVLAPATRQQVSDGVAIDDLLADLGAARRPAILPWGVGKWLGRRGRHVGEIVNRQTPGVMLGDNASRPGALGRPALFRRAAGLGVPVLPGTDPLPIAAGEAVVGSFGFVFEVPITSDDLARDMATRLFDLRAQPRIFGSGQPFGRILRQQIQLRRGA